MHQAVEEKLVAIRNEAEEKKQASLCGQALILQRLSQCLQSRKPFELPKCIVRNKPHQIITTFITDNSTSYATGPNGEPSAKRARIQSSKQTQTTQTKSKSKAKSKAKTKAKAKPQTNQDSDSDYMECLVCWIKNNSKIKTFRLLWVLFEKRFLLGFFEIVHIHLHSSVLQRHHTRFHTNRLPITSFPHTHSNIRSWQIILRLNNRIQVHITIQTHLTLPLTPLLLSHRMNRKDPLLALRIRQRQFNLSVDSSRSQQRRIQRFYPIRRHDHLHIAAIIESIQLIQQLQHRSLHFACSRRVRIVSLRSDRVDFIDKHDRRRHIARRSEDIAHQLRSYPRFPPPNAPSPAYFCTNSLPTSRRNVADVLFATAFARSVFPVPGSP